MKRKKFNILNILMPALFLVLLVTSCKEDDDSDMAPDKMFRPGTISIVSGETEALIRWNPSVYTIPGEVVYSIDVSKDTLFNTVDHTFESNVNELLVTDETLEVRTRYFARVKANQQDQVSESEWTYSLPFTIRGEQIFLALQESDVIDIAVKLKWRESPDLTHIVLTPDGGQSINVNLSDDDREERLATISDLTPGTAYVAEIYKDEIYKGTANFTTKPALVGDIVDLRTIIGRPGVLLDTLPFVTSGSIIVLKRGETYNMSSTTVLDKSLTILSGPDFIPELATIYFTSNFNFAADSEIDHLIFRDLNMYSDNYGGRYIFNVTASGTVGHISFESCNISIFRGVLRLQSGGARVNKYSVINSVLDSIREFAVAHVSASCFLDNIEIKNSTVYNAQRFIFSLSPSNSVIVENCTFDRVPNWNNFLIDYNAVNVASPIAFNNNIIGSNRDEGLTGGGWRAGSETSLSAENSYVTSEFNTANPIPGLIVYNNLSTVLWMDPLNGDFRFRDGNFAGRNSAGDPRWRP